MNEQSQGTRSWRLNEHLTIALVSTLILCCAWLSSATDEKVQVMGVSLPPLCGFKLLTTWDCPGCGLTRSLVLAMHGQMSASYTMHIWGIPLLGILLFQVPYRLLKFKYPSLAIPKLPPTVKRWISPAIFLSILLPWGAKILALVVVRYL